MPRIEDHYDHDLSFREYLNHPALNAGRIEWGMLSMHALKKAIDGELDQDDTQALGFGRALHSRVLTPDLFDREFAVAKVCAGATKEGRPCSKVGGARYGGEWLCHQHAYGEPEPIGRITPSDLERVETIASVLEGHVAGKLLGQPDRNEVSGFVHCGGRDLKCRCDVLIGKTDKKPAAIFDLKTIAPPKNPSKAWDFRKTIRRAIEDNGYHRKAAFYVDLHNLIAGDYPDFAWIFVMSGPPYEVAIQWAHDWIPIGREQYSGVLDRMDEAEKTGKWGFAIPDAEVAHPPEWMMKQSGEGGGA